MEVIEYNLDFIYEATQEIVWADNLKLNKEWEIVRIKNMRTIQKSYKGKTPNYTPTHDYKIALYHLNKWIYLKNGKGKTVTSSTNKIIIPNLTIKNCEFTPNLAIYRFTFDFHTLLTFIQMNNLALIHEYKKISLTSAQIHYKNCKINIYENILSYRGKEHKDFEHFSKLIESIYKKECKNIKNIFDKIEKTFPQPKDLHISISYKTWYNAKRENQRQWPNISKVKTKDSIEFPKGSGIYYSYENMYVGLARRTDFNTEKYIPRIYAVNHSDCENTILYKYLRNIEIKDVESKKEEKTKMGNVKAQILDKNRNRMQILINDKWENSRGKIIENVPALPYNYKQIIHDFAVIGKLEIGNIMDLTHIGIVDRLTHTEKITYPIYPSYLNKNIMETQRLLTLKVNYNEVLTIIV